VNLNWEEYVRFDEKYLRPTEVDTLIANPSKAERDLAWKSQVSPERLASIMVNHDIKTIEGFIADEPVGTVWSEATS
jgi:GDPmannose 4,6-dehydratase